MMNDAQIEIITLERGLCYGTCPAYTMTLRRDGRASWHGEAFTSPIGDFDAELDRGRHFAHLAAFIQRAGFYTWDSDYSTDITDQPEYVLEVSGRGHGKRVRQYGTNEPPDFWVIARLVDACALEIGWGVNRD